MSKSHLSLSEVHKSVSVPDAAHNVSFWRRLAAFGGPAYLVSVGYMDPGNWATDLEGGATFGYTLLWVLVMSNLMALLLQSLSARLGIVSGKDLAQACRIYYPLPVAISLWILCEIAIIACDLAEVLGTALGLFLLFKIPLLWGVLITSLDVFVLLALQRLGMRKLETVIIGLVILIGGCFLVEMFLAKPDLIDVAHGLIPQLNDKSLYIAIGIIGATVMPHNLYLHSALVQTRNFEQTSFGRRLACKFNFIDSAIALNGAFFINAAILILAGSVFYTNGRVVTDIVQAHELLTPLLGTAMASILFAVALLASGQSSTITGTLAGQIVMEGFLHLKINPAMRRFITRALAVVPAALVLSIMGESSTIDLLILSQVILSMQLSFAVIPLIRFTSNKKIMGEFANKLWVQILAWITAAIVLSLNIKLLMDKELEALSAEGTSHTIGLIALPFLLGIFVLLVYILLKKPSQIETPTVVADTHVAPTTATSFMRIGVAVEAGANDEKLIGQAMRLAGEGAHVILIHIASSASGFFNREKSHDAAVVSGEKYLASLVQKYSEENSASSKSIISKLGYGPISKELVRIAKEEKLDLLVLGSHRHRGIKDLFFGATVSPVRHALDIPIFIVQ